MQISTVPLSQLEPQLGIGFSAPRLSKKSEDEVELNKLSLEMGGGIGIAEVLHDSNIMALVGGGPYPAFFPKKIIVWDDADCTRKAEITLKSPVKAVRIKLRL